MVIEMRVQHPASLCSLSGAETKAAASITPTPAYTRLPLAFDVWLGVYK